MSILRPYQREAIDAVNAAWNEGMQRPAVVMATGLGKGHPAYTEVPTPEGLRKWGDLRSGDSVFGRDGSPVRVLDVYDRGVLPTYVVQFSDGASVVVDGDHLWQVRDRKFRNTRADAVMSTADITASGLRYGSSYRFRIPLASPVRRDAVDLPVDPYTLGALIANGWLAGAGTQLTTPDTEVVERIRLSHRANRVKDTTEGVCDRYSLPGLSPLLRDLGLNVLSAEKHIPAPYLEASVGDRIALLQGLMDGDGSSRSGGRRSVIYHTTSRALAGDVVELVTSLGGTASPKWYRRVRGGLVSEECQVFVLLPLDTDAFGTSRRVRAEKPKRSFAPRRAIVSITPAGDQRITCIRVDAEDSLYLVTRHHIVTHNTVLFAHTAREFMQGNPGQRTVVLVHRDELADQAMNKIRSVAPELDVGKVKAGDDEVHADVVVASVQTLARKRRMSRLLAAGPVGLVIVDEVHHYASRTFRGVLEGLGCFAQDGAWMLGVTATLARGDGMGLGGVVEDVVYTRSILWGIRNGFLVEPAGISVAVEGLDLSRLRKSGGDYAVGALGEELSESGAMAAAAAAYAEHGEGRPGVVFTPTVATAHEAMKELELRGIPSAVVSGETPREERLQIFSDYESGRLQVLANCMVLTEGWDAPWASCAVIARPTQSQPLYTQMVGRILRPHPGKDGALILDLVGASRDNRLKTLIDLEEGIFPEARVCENCGRLPCACPCAGCGEPKRNCICPKEEAKAPELSGTGGKLELFAASSTAWLRTHRGIWFIACGTVGEVLLWPEGGGMFSIALAPQQGAWRKLGHQGPQVMEVAMAWAEEEAEELGGVLTRRGSRWRKDEPSEAQLSALWRLGVSPPDHLRKGDVGDLLSVELASRKIDRFVKE